MAGALQHLMQGVDLRRPCPVSVQLLPACLMCTSYLHLHVFLQVQMQMQYMREGEPVAAGAVMAGAHVRPAEELVTALRKVRLLAGTTAQ